MWDKKPKHYKIFGNFQKNKILHRVDNELNAATVSPIPTPGMRGKPFPRLGRHAGRLVVRDNGCCSRDSLFSVIL